MLYLKGLLMFLVSRMFQMFKCLLMFFLVIICFKLSNTGLFKKPYFCQLSVLGFKIFPSGEFHNLEVLGFP